LYNDLPGGRRSGVGRVAEINKLWEGIYNLSPDILLIKEGVLLLLEVDNTFNLEYEKKLLRFKEKKQQLIEGLERVLERKIQNMNFGFVSKSKKIPTDINEELRPFHFLYYSDEQINEIITCSEI
jgi:hypothetical protein